MNNELSRIHSLLDSDGTTHLAEYTYLGRDRTVQVDFPQPGAKFTYIKQGSESPTDGGDQYTGWDRFGRAIDLRWIKNSSGAELERLKHGYDRASNRLYRKNLVALDADKQDELYTYDGLSQLSIFQRGVLNTGRTAITGTPIAEEDFTFDPTGNWNEYVRKASGSTTLDQTRTHNKANELTAIDSSSSLVAEDVAGNMTKVPKPDSWSSAYDLKYDAWNRLVEVKDGSTVVATYAYDGLNRRTKKVMGSDTRHFYYTDKWQIIEERVNASTSADRQFVWGIRFTDDLVLRDKGTERLYVIQDYFQPTAVMDTSGAVLERYGYEAFGTSRVMTPSYGSRDPSSYEWETRFGAYRWDGETQMLQVRNRYLHTQLGRWVTRDPIGYGDGNNLYIVVENNPVCFIDAEGLTTVKKHASSISENQAHNRIWGWTDLESQMETPAKLKLRNQKCCVVKKPEMVFTISVQTARSGKQAWTENAVFNSVSYPDTTVNIGSKLAKFSDQHEEKRYQAWKTALTTFWSAHFEDIAATLTAPTCSELEGMIDALRKKATNDWDTSAEGLGLVKSLLQIGTEGTSVTRFVRKSGLGVVKVEYESI